MVVLGQLAAGVDPGSIEVGQEMELVLGTLYEDDENEYMVWKWKPAVSEGEALTGQTRPTGAPGSGRRPDREARSGSSIAEQDPARAETSTPVRAGEERER